MKKYFKKKRKVARTMKMKNAIAFVTAFCIMASTTAPTLAATTYSETPSSTIQVPEQSPQPTQPPIMEDSSQSNDGVEQREETEESTESTAPVAPTHQPVEQPTQTDNSTTESTAGSSSIVPDSQLDVQEAPTETVVQVAEEKPAPTVPGFSLYTQDTINTNRQYLIVAQKKDASTAYALYLSQKGKNISPGSLNTQNNGAVTAQLNIQGETLSAVYLNDNSPLELNDLLLDVTQENGGYSFYNSKNKLYLSLSNTMVSDQKAILTPQNNNGVWILQNGGRKLDFNVNGVGNGQGSYQNNATDFWGPNTAGNYNIYLYSKNIDLPDEHLDIKGYTKVEASQNLTNGEYLITAAQNQGKFSILSTADTSDFTQVGQRDDTGYLQNQQEILKGADFSLTITDNSNRGYLSTIYNGQKFYLTLKDGKTVASDQPQLLSFEKQENGSYIISNDQGQKLSLTGENFTANGSPTAVLLYKKEGTVALSQTKVVLEKGFMAKLHTTQQPTWCYTDSTGVYAPVLQWELTNTQDAVTLKGDELTALKEQGTAQAVAKIMYGNNKYTQSIDGTVEIQVVLPKSNLKGTTNGQPFQSNRVQGESSTADSQMFRIPALITLKDGTMLAAADARWNSTMDSASNLDGLVSYSKDGGKTWQWQLVNHFEDYSNNTQGAPRESASFIDPALIQGENGKVYMVADACPAYVGLQNGGFAERGTGFNAQGNLVIAKGEAGQPAPRNKEAYTYYIDQAAAQKVEINGKTYTLRPIKDNTNQETGNWVDAEYNLYQKHGDQWEKSLCKQADTNEMVQNNVFYSQSEWKIFPTFHIWLRTGQQTDQGIAWGDPEILNIKQDNEGFVGVCPGRGITTTVNGKERLIFQVYDNATGNELASTIYSDDQGKTWHRGSRADNLNGTGKSSESQIIALPDGGLRMYSRGNTHYIGYTDSYDGGQTWGKYRQDPNLRYSGNCMISLINIEGYLEDSSGNVYGNLVMASYPYGPDDNGFDRQRGIIRVGSVNKNNVITWLDKGEVRYTGKYQYSCLTQKNGQEIGLLYETQDQEWAPGWGWIVYDDFTLTDILGAEWKYSSTTTKPVNDGKRGITKNQPYVPSQTGGSQKFRIPALLTLQNGWILSAADARWGNTADSASNLDGLVSVSKDGGKTWEWEMINHFADFPDETDQPISMSASFIDPALVQGKDGTVYMVSDACPANVGLRGGIVGNESTGFNQQGNLIIAKGEVGKPASTKAADYTYYIDAKDSVITTIESQSIVLHPIKDTNHQKTGIFVDVEYNLYQQKDANYLPVMCQQMDTGKTIQNNVFYSQSEWKVYPTFHIWLRTAKVEGNELKWQAPQILNVKKEGEGFVGVCPGRGLQIETKADGSERILFQVYDNATGNELASSIYSDDGGKTWQRGEHTNQLQNTGKSSESQTILLPNGDLRMYSRNSIGYISYADSKDGGKTWGESQYDEQLAYVGNCMVSFINVDGVLLSPEGKAYSNLIAASYPQGSGRNNGVIRIGNIDPQTNQVDWLNSAEIRYPGSYLYSCLTQIKGNTLGLLFEKEDTQYGTGYIHYDSFGLTDIMGQGWNYLAEKPQGMPALTVSMPQNQLYKGQTATIKGFLQDTPKDTTIEWNISGEEGVVSLDKTTTLDKEEVVVTALKAGKATLTATAKVNVGGESITLTANQPIYISDDTTITIPDEFDKNSMTALGEVYQKQQGQPTGGSYVIYSNQGNRLLYFAKGSETTNQVTPSITDDRLALDKNYASTRQTWNLKQTDQGYTIESCDQAGKYLTITGETSNHLPVSNSPMYFTITDVGQGQYSISTKINEEMYYLYFNGKFGATKSLDAKIGLYQNTSLYEVETVGLQNLIQYVSKLNPDDYTTETWDILQSKLKIAQQAIQIKPEYTQKQEAEQVFATVQQACKDLYKSMLDLKKKESVVPTPEPTPAPTPVPEPTPTPSPVVPTPNPVPPTNPTPTQKPTFTAKPSNTQKPTISTSTGDKILKEEVQEAFKNQKTSTVEIDVTKRTVLSSVAFALLAEKENGLLRLKGNGYNWIFDGNAMLETKDLGEWFDSKVTFQISDEAKKKISEYLGNTDSFIALETAYNGKLPAKATLQIQLEKQTYGGKEWDMYYLPDSGEIQQLGTVMVSEQGIAEIPMEHCSIYFFALKEKEEKPVSESSSQNQQKPDSSTADTEQIIQQEQNQQKSWLAPVLAVLAVTTAILGGIFWIKKKKQ